MRTLITLVFMAKLSLAQISGEFWWLNDEVTKLKGKKAPPPHFEQVNEFDTDETDKIVFRDYPINNLEPRVEKNYYKNETKYEKIKTGENFEDNNNISWPNGINNQNIILLYNNNTQEQVTVSKTTDNESKHQIEDQFNFHFPKDDNAWKNLFDENKNSITMKPKKTKIKNMFGEKITFNNTDKSKIPNSENICSYMKKNDCYRRNGLIYKLNESNIFNVINEYQSVCCILPLTKDSYKITFPDLSSRLQKRHKRSPTRDSTDMSLQQRNILLQRKYTTQSSNLKTRHTQAQENTDDDYEDPYWNIKNIHLKTPNTQNSPVNKKNKCNYQDYVEDYTVELPKPGLLGVYSDHGGPPNWSNSNKGSTYEGTIDEYEYDDEPGGYSSTIDPRRDTHLFKTSEFPRPLKVSTNRDSSYDPESQIVSYQSNPDFQVLQGFKLLNVARNKHKIYEKNSKKSTTGNFEQVSDDSLIIETNSKDSNDFVRQQIFKNCGRILTSTKILNADQQIGNAANGSHPWLALVVLSKRRQGILCYATVIHPRAALTTADCVYGKTNNGGITIITGVWDLKDRSRSQNRVASSIIHPQYKPNELNYNLAIIHWTQPLRLGLNVQPACVGDARLADDCKLFGWGGFDQGIRTRSRWQRASILSPHQCRTRLSANQRVEQLAGDIFCASVQTRGTVTGVGGPLICNTQGRRTIVGVAVWRDTIILLMPVQEWALSTLETLVDDL